MFGLFIKPKWKNADCDVRLEAIHSLDPADPEDKLVLKELSIDDPDVNVRLAALKRLGDTRRILALPQDIENADIKDALFDALSSKICEVNDPADATLFLQTDWLFDTPKFAEYLALHAKCEAIRLKAITTVTKESVLSQVVANDDSHDIRVKALEKIDNEDQLSRLYKSIKKRDKSAAKLIKEKLQTIQLKYQNDPHSLDVMDDICVHVEALLLTTNKAEARTKLAEFKASMGNQVQSLVDQDDEIVKRLIARFERAVNNANKHIAAIVEKPVENEKREEVVTAATFDDLSAQVNTAKDPENLRKNSECFISQAQYEQLTSQDGTPRQHQSLTQNYKALCGMQNELDEYHKLLKARDSVLKRIDGYLSNEQHQEPLCGTVLSKLRKRWGSGSPLFYYHYPKQKTDIFNEKFAQLEQKLVAIKVEYDVLCEKQEKYLTSAETHLDEGGFNKARELYNKANSLNKKLPSSYKRRHSALLSRIHHRINELFDWNKYASEPKKEALIEVVTKLADHPRSDLSEQAHLIQEAREMWKTLGGGTDKRSKQAWEIFNDACERAYAPCTQFFDKKSSERLDNYHHRLDIINQMKGFYNDVDWVRADWVSAERTYNGFKKAWAEAGPTDRKLKTELKSKFDDVSKQILAEFDKWWSENTALKKEIITQAQALEESEDPVDAAEQIKKLQQKWKNIGHTHPGKEKQLWDAFRLPSDSIFERREAAYQSQRDEKDKALAEISQIIESLESIAASPVSQITERADEFVAGLRNVQDLSKTGGSDKTRRKIAHVKQAFDKKQANAKQLSSLNKVLHTLDVLEKLDVAQARLYDNDETAIAEVEALVHALNETDSAVRKTAQSRAKAVLAAALSQPRVSGELEEKLRGICIRFEIVNDISSPAEDNDRRMQIQVEALSEALHNENKDRSLLEKGIEIIDIWNTFYQNHSKLKVLSERYQRVLALWRQNLVEHFQKG